MKFFFLGIAIIAIGCNSNQQASNEKDVPTEMNRCFSYPSSIDSLQLRDLYDSARWYVYTWHCDEYYRPKKDISKSITFGELPLRFNNMDSKGDTVEISFDFIDEHESYPILPSTTRDTKELNTGVGFNVKIRNKIYMLSPSGYSYTIKGGTNRYENPLQPEVLAYIKNNWDKLDDCFRKLAEKNGIKP